MKKVVLFLLIVFCSSLLFAYQETYREDSYEVKVFRSLKRITGDNPVEPTYPISGTQLANMYRTLNSQKLPKEGRELYSKILDSLDNRFFNTDWNDETASVELRTDVNLEAFIRSTNKRTSYDKLYNDLPSMDPMLNLGSTIWLGDYAAGRFDYSFGEQFTTDYFNKHFYHSILVSSPDEKCPNEAWLSIGTGLYNVILGRDNLSAGNGKLGNLMFSDNFMWEDFSKASVITKTFSYDLVFLTMGREEKQGVLTSTDFDSDSNFIANHRFSASVFNYATVSLYEGMLEYGSNMMQNLSMLNPFMCLHNIESYSAGNNNNYFGVEVSANLTHGFEFSTQFMFDQIQFKDEVSHNEGKIPSNAYAGLANVAWSGFVNKGLLDAYFETSYVSPVCYLKENNSRDSLFYAWQTDFILGNMLDKLDYYNYLGYPMGPDSLTFAFGAQYLLDKLTVSCDTSFSLRGDYGINGNQVINTAWKYFRSAVPLTTVDGNKPEHNYKYGIKASYEIYPGISFSSSLAYIRSINLYNQAGVNLNDLQYSIGAKIKCVDLAKLFLCK